MLPASLAFPGFGPIHGAGTQELPQSWQPTLPQHSCFAVCMMLVWLQVSPGLPNAFSPGLCGSSAWSCHFAPSAARLSRPDAVEPDLTAASANCCTSDAESLPKANFCTSSNHKGLWSACERSKQGCSFLFLLPHFPIAYQPSLLEPAACKLELVWAAQEVANKPRAFQPKAANPLYHHGAVQPSQPMPSLRAFQPLVRPHGAFQPKAANPRAFQPIAMYHHMAFQPMSAHPCKAAPINATTRAACQVGV